MVEEIEGLGLLSQCVFVSKVFWVIGFFGANFFVIHSMLLMFGALFLLLICFFVFFWKSFAEKILFFGVQIFLIHFLSIFITPKDPTSA